MYGTNFTQKRESKGLGAIVACGKKKANKIPHKEYLPPDRILLKSRPLLPMTIGCLRSMDQQPPGPISLLERDLLVILNSCGVPEKEIGKLNSNVSLNFLLKILQLLLIRSLQSIEKL
jgi:hypothetical protein